jgi:hypothetical protein
MQIWTSNHVIDGNGDEGRLTCYFLVLLSGRPFRTEGKGTYRCTLRRVAGAWRFREVHTSLG